MTLPLATPGHLTIVRADSVDVRRVVKPVRIGAWEVDADLLSGAVVVFDPEQMLPDGVCFQAADVPQTKEKRK